MLTVYVAHDIQASEEDPQVLDFLAADEQIVLKGLDKPACEAALRSIGFDDSRIYLPITALSGAHPCRALVCLFSSRDNSMHVCVRACLLACVSGCDQVWEHSGQLAPGVVHVHVDAADSRRSLQTCVPLALVCPGSQSRRVPATLPSGWFRSY